VSRRLGVLEMLTPFVVAALFVLSCRHIAFDPENRMGQISAIATIEWRLLLCSLPLFVALAWATRTRRFEATSRFVCAALAGLASATVAAGILIMLRKTHFGLGGIEGDSGVLADWAERINAGDGMYSPIYPPLQVYAIAWLAKLLAIYPIYAIKTFQILGVALVGPLAYTTWRLWFRPGAALLVGAVPSLVLIECYRPYPLLVLVAFVPVLLKFLQLVRHAATIDPARLVRCGVLIGLALGVMFLMYSGWFQWSAPGFAVAFAIVFPWKQWRNAALLCGVTLFTFLLVTAPYLLAVVRSPPIRDEWVYFDALVEPAYVAMWRGGLPGNLGGPWPPVGELGGVGLFTVLLALGAGLAVARGHKRTLVLGAASILAGGWLFRFFYARSMWSSKLVQLWPRTTAELLYVMVVLSAVAVTLWLRDLDDDHPLRGRGALVGAIAGTILLFGSTSSALIDKYMPKEAVADSGHMAYLALHDIPVEQNQLQRASVVASSSYEAKYWSEGGAIDHKLWRGYSSALGRKTNHEESLTLDMHQAREFRRVLLHPAMDGFPIDLVIEGWDGTRFVTLKIVTNLPQTYMFPQTIQVGEQWTNIVRIRATKLRPLDNGDYVFRLAEVELYR